MRGYQLFLKALCLWLSALTFAGPQAFAHTNDTDYGRAQVTWPDLGHEGGSTLQTKITDGIKKLSDNLTGRWTGDLTVANLGTSSIIHNFGLAIAKLKILVFVSGSQLTAAQQAAAFTFTETDTNTIQVQNISGSSQTFQVVILAYRGGIVSADLDPALDVDTTGTLRASELRTSSNGDVVVNHNAAQSGADWKAQLHRPTSGMSGNAVYTLPLASATFATTSLSETLTNKNLKSSTNLLTGAKSDSFVTETGSNTVTLPSAGGTLSTLAGSESLTNKNLGSSTNTLTGATAGSFTNTGTVTLPTSTTTLVGRDTTDNLTNKTISSSSFNGGTASSTQFITLPSATLATLQALSRTAGKLYYATDTSQVMYDNGSNLQAVGSGSGSGIKNYLSQDFETDTTGISGYADAAATTPVDGTGSTATTLTISRTTTSGEVLDGTGSLKVAKSAANGQGQGVSIDFVMDLAYRSKGQSVSLQYKTDHANYVAGDAVLCLYDKDLASLITISGADVGVCRAIPKGVGTLQATWNGSTSDDYRFIIHVSTTNASAYDLFFDKPLVTPIILTDGVPFTDQESFTPPTSQGFGTLSAVALYKYRSGQLLKVDGRFTTGNVTASEARIGLPTGLTIAGLTSGTMVGTWHINDGTGNTIKRGPLYADSTTSTYVTFQRDDYTTATSPFAAGLAGNTVTSNNNTVIGINFTVPISQWTGSGNIINGPRIECATNTSTATAADDTTSFSNSCEGSLIQNITAALKRRVRWATAMQPGDQYLVQASANRTRWVTITGGRNLPGNTQNISGYMDQANVTYGMGRLGDVNTTDMDLYFGTYAVDAGGAYGAAGSSWTAQGGSSTYWRVLKLSGVAAQAYAEATATTPGFVSPGTQTFGGTKTFTGTVNLSNKPIWSAYVGTNQSTANGVDVKMNFDTVSVDTRSGFDTTNKKYTVPTGEGGVYRIIAHLQMNDNTQATNFQLLLKKQPSPCSDDTTGVSTLFMPNFTPYQSAYNNMLDLHWVGTLSAGDCVKMYVNHGDGANRTVLSGSTISIFSGEKIN